MVAALVELKGKFGLAYGSDLCLFAVDIRLPAGVVGYRGVEQTVLDHIDVALVAGVGELGGAEGGLSELVVALCEQLVVEHRAV